MAKVFKDLLSKGLNAFQRLQGVRPFVNPGTYEAGDRSICKLKQCECNWRGAEMCFGCAVQPDYQEAPLVFHETDRPRWWRRWIRTRLSPQDVQFLTGIRPHYKRRR